MKLFVADVEHYCRSHGTRAFVEGTIVGATSVRNPIQTQALQRHRSEGGHRFPLGNSLGHHSTARTWWTFHALWILFQLDAQAAACHLHLAPSHQSRSESSHTRVRPTHKLKIADSESGRLAASLAFVFSATRLTQHHVSLRRRQVSLVLISTTAPTPPAAPPHPSILLRGPLPKSFPVSYQILARLRPRPFCPSWA